jgi:hypothetical protein
LAELEELARLNPSQTDWILGQKAVFFHLQGLSTRPRRTPESCCRTRTPSNDRMFLELWKDADPGLPEVEEGKKRPATL